MPTSKRRPQPLQKVFSQNDRLAALADTAKRFDALTDAVRQALPRDVQPGLVCANLRDETLVLVAHTAAWAARLRFHAPDILTSLEREQHLNLQKFAIRVSLPQA